ncbi:MAG: PAS domain S-box protein [Anaerolineae bacterium]|nr:PAS domain S-box protein [Anaerolineae bacterium]
MSQPTHEPSLTSASTPSSEASEVDRILSLSMDMVGIVDFEGRFLKLNAAWEATLGYRVEEMLGRHFVDFLHPDDRETTLQLARAMLEDGDMRSFENRYRHRDGSYRWLYWQARSYPDVRLTYCVARDVTPRKRTEENLHQARDLLMGIMANSGNVIYVKDIYGHYVLANPQYQSYLQLSESMIVGQTDYDLFSTDIADQIQAHENWVMDHRRSIQVEEYIPGDDRLHTFLATKFPLFDRDGALYGVCTIATDITYRKITEMQLLLRNRAIEASPTGISIADMLLPDTPLIYINPAFEKTTGYTALDVIGRNCRFLQGTDRDQPGLTAIRAALREQRAVTVVLRNYRKDGTLFYNELSLAPIHNDEGVLTHYVGISTDVTGRVLAEEKIQSQNQELVLANFELSSARKAAEDAAAQIQQQNEALMEANRELAYARRQAEEATRLKSQFLATMSHELRTPLNAIIGYTEIQLAGMAGELTQEQRDYQERVLANADHLLQLINDVLDIAKIEAGRLEIVDNPFDVRVWLDELIGQTQGLAVDKRLSFEVSIDERMPRVIIGDTARLKQIAINLVSNAIKFTESGGVRIQVRLHGRDAWKFIVSDTGIGIPSHLLETIFEEFRQVDSSSQRKQGGTGLGLSIVRKLTLMMGGNVRVSSELGKGSTFTVILPLREPK